MSDARAKRPTDDELAKLQAALSASQKPAFIPKTDALDSVTRDPSRVSAKLRRPPVTSPQM